MSVSDPALSEQVTRAAVEQFDNLHALTATFAGVVSQSVRALAFWAATLLPLSYLPLLATGVAAERPLGFAGLLCVNTVAFVVGHAHNRGHTHPSDHDPDSSPA